MIPWRTVRNRLEELGIRPRKSLGQNFLTDSRIIHRIVELVDPRPGDAILEIGAGPGLLTIALADKAGPGMEGGPAVTAVTAVEIDGRLVDAARENAGPDSAIRWVHGDFLALEMREIWGREVPIEAKAVGNLPFLSAMPIMFKLLETPINWLRLVLMFQKEVAERIAAAPGSGTYGIPTVKVGARYVAELAMTAPPGAFWPNPKVHSSLVVLKPRTDARDILDKKIFNRVVNAGFSTRRKTLLNALSGGADDLGISRPQWNELIRGRGLDPSTRAERLSPDEFVDLSNAVARGAE